MNRGGKRCLQCGKIAQILSVVRDKHGNVGTLYRMLRQFYGNFKIPDRAGSNMAYLCQKCEGDLNKYFEFQTKADNMKVMIETNSKIYSSMVVPEETMPPPPPALPQPVMVQEQPAQEAIVPEDLEEPEMAETHFTEKVFAAMVNKELTIFAKEANSGFLRAAIDELPHVDLTVMRNRLKERVPITWKILRTVGTTQSGKFNETKVLTALSILLYSRSVQLNLFPTLIAMSLFQSGLKTRDGWFLTKLGIMVSSNLVTKRIRKALEDRDDNEDIELDPDIHDGESDFEVEPPSKETYTSSDEDPLEYEDDEDDEDFVVDQKLKYPPRKTQPKRKSIKRSAGRPPGRGRPKRSRVQREKALPDPVVVMTKLSENATDKLKQLKDTEPAGVPIQSTQGNTSENNGNVLTPPIIQDGAMASIELAGSSDPVTAAVHKDQSGTSWIKLPDGRLFAVVPTTKPTGGETPATKVVPLIGGGTTRVQAVAVKTEPVDKNSDKSSSKEVATSGGGKQIHTEDGTSEEAAVRD